MKRLIVFLAVVVMAGVLAGGVYAAAGEGGKGDAAKCEESFKSMDMGNKGYLTQRDFEMKHHDPGKHKGYPVGSTKQYTHFDNKDANKDGRVTMEEFCKI